MTQRGGSNLERAGEKKTSPRLQLLPLPSAPSSMLPGQGLTAPYAQAPATAPANCRHLANLGKRPMRILETDSGQSFRAWLQSMFKDGGTPSKEAYRKRTEQDTLKQNFPNIQVHEGHLESMLAHLQWRMCIRKQRKEACAWGKLSGCMLGAKQIAGKTEQAWGKLWSPFYMCSSHPLVACGN